MEDLNAGIINSRKLSVKAIVTLQVKVETLCDVDAAVEVDTKPTSGDAPSVETLRKKVDVATVALHHKDTFRIKDTISLSGNKPNIDHILWNEMILRGVTTRPTNER